MAAEESAPEFCQITRETFGNLIQKPPLTDKLLSRPPFRFLHDVISAVIRQSGFLNGLYSEDELDAKKVTEKEAKMGFLQKCLDSVQFANGEKLDVNVGKVVAGKDAEKTNLFLQKLAQAARSTSPDASEQIVKRVLAGDKPTDENLLNNSGGSAGSNKENRESKPEKKRSSSKEKREKSKDSDQKKHSSSKDKDKAKDKEKDKEKKSKSSSHKEDEKSAKKKGDSKKKSSSSKSSGEKKGKREKSSDKSPPKPSSSVEREQSEPKIILTNGHAEDMSVEINHAQEDEMPEFSQKDTNKGESSPTRPISTSAKPHGREMDSIELPTTQPRLTRSARPMTAGGRPGTASGTRKAPPRLKRRELGEIENPAPRIDSAGSQKETTNLIMAQADSTVARGDVQEEEDNFIVEEPIPTLGDVILAEEAGDGGGDFVDAGQLDPSDHGALVGRMLETTKQLEAELGEDSLPERPLVVFDEREREKISKETAKTQELVQQLTRTVHPLGRLVDYLQEDVDSMLKELEQWQAEYKKNSVKLRQMQKTERSDLEPLRLKLNELDEQIREKRDGIAAVRGELLGNREKLVGLINSVGK